MAASKARGEYTQPIEKLVNDEEQSVIYLVARMTKNVNEYNNNMRESTVLLAKPNKLVVNILVSSVSSCCTKF